MLSVLEISISAPNWVCGRVFLEVRRFWGLVSMPKGRPRCLG